MVGERDPHGLPVNNPGAWIALSLAPATGAVLGRAFAAAARVLATERAADPDRGWRDPASLTCASIPIAAALYAPGPGAALAMTGVGWLLLGIAVCDERTLRIPHLLWIGGIGAGLVIAWSVGGWAGVGARALGAAVLDGVLLLCAGAARLVRKRAAVGAADYGVVAFVAAVCGPGATVDVLLLGGAVALASIVERQAAPGRQAAVSVASLTAVLAAALLGVAGAAAGALVLALLATRASRSSRPASAAPLGSCLAAATILLVLAAGAWPRSAGSPLHDDVVLHILQPDSP
jgi:hypothetical protein